MRLSSILIVLGTFLAAAVTFVVLAYFAAQVVEDASKTGVRTELDRDALTWADVDTNGLQVFLIGTAPTEAARFQALSAAGRVVDAARVIDQMNVEEPDNLTPPRFSLEILRNDGGVSLIGLVPAATDRAQIVARIVRSMPSAPVADLMEIADYPTPGGWNDALDYAIKVLPDLTRSKISVEPAFVQIKGTVESASQKRQLESELARRAGSNLRLALQLNAPRPVISPFTLRFIKDVDGARFDACSADTDATRMTLISVASSAGVEGKVDCRIGLGVPTQRWAEATTMGIQAIEELGGGTITFADADVALVALEGTEQALFDRVVGALENGLPDVFALTATLPKAPEASGEGPPEFVATRSPEGDVQLRGRINSEIARQTADSFARASFGVDSVRTSARIDENLPSDWAARVLAGLEALAQLSNGAVVVSPDSVNVSGNTGNPDAGAQIAGFLADKLGEAETFDIRVTYQEKLDPTLAIPTPEQCEAKIVEIIGDRKITFEPSSATLDGSAKDIMDEIAELLKLCGDIPLEIAGHTDSQGREIMNQQLSQERAQAVLDALRDRRVFTSSYRVKGYGEEQPIADNGTEEGREANRRIEFTLIRPEPIPETETTLESVEQPAPGADNGTTTGEEGSTDEQN